MKQFLLVVREAQQEALLNPEDVKAIEGVVTSLSQPVVDITASMEEQSRLRAVVGYFYKLFDRAARAVEDELEEMWLRHYNTIYKVKYGGDSRTPALKTKDIGRFSEKLITSVAMQDPLYSEAHNRARRIRYFSDQMLELRDTLISRARLLERMSYNNRSSE